MSAEERVLEIAGHEYACALQAHRSAVECTLEIEAIAERQRTLLQARDSHIGVVAALNVDHDQACLHLGDETEQPNEHEIKVLADAAAVQADIAALNC